MTDLPSGTVTFLFTDVEGSTRLIKALGRERYARVLADHEHLVRASFAAADGQDIDTQGDAFFVVFSQRWQCNPRGGSFAKSTGGSFLAGGR